MKYYRVKYGYGRDEFYSVDETEVQTALRAQITGKVAVLTAGTIAGNNIMAIAPDYNRALGLNPEYQLAGEDYRELGDETIKEHQRFLSEMKQQLAVGKSSLMLEG